MIGLDLDLDHLADLVADRVMARLATGNGNGHGSGPDRLLDAKAAAQVLGVRVRWLYRHAARLPFVVRPEGRLLRFSEAGIEKYIAKRKPITGRGD
jgi:predicted DNA-binding transcriptional regulator AlpA